MMDTAIRDNTVETLSKMFSKQIVSNYVGTMAEIVREMVPDIKKEIWIGNYLITVKIH